MVSLSEFANGVMPIGEYVPLEPGKKYWAVAQWRGIWMGATARIKGLPQKFKFIPEFGMPFMLDGDSWSNVIVFSVAQGNTAGLPNYNVVLQTDGNFQLGLSSMLGVTFNAAQAKGSNTIARMLEMVYTAQGSYNLYMNALIASAGGDVVKTVSGAAGDLISVDWMISYDTAGTSPHSSYISLIDGDANKILYVLGGHGAHGSKMLRLGTAGTLTGTLHNGDSVSHTFLLNVYGAIA